MLFAAGGNNSIGKWAGKAQGRGNDVPAQPRPAPASSLLHASASPSNENNSQNAFDVDMEPVGSALLRLDLPDRQGAAGPNTAT